MQPKKILEIFKRFKAQNPTPKTELIYHSHFQLLIAVILSAQSTDKVVNQVTAPLFQVAPDAHKMAKMPLEDLIGYLKRLGLHQQKAKYILETSQILVQNYSGQVPCSRDQLEKLPGVGRKTANVVLNTAFRIPVMAVDTHIFRVSQRIGLSKASTPLGVEKDLIQVIPEDYLLDAHHWLILHGRYICQARKPLCYKCLISDLCEYKKKSEI